MPCSHRCSTLSWQRVWPSAQAEIPPGAGSVVQAPAPNVNVVIKNKNRIFASFHQN
jgi:hypothetical protein